MPRLQPRRTSRFSWKGILVSVASIVLLSFLAAVIFRTTLVELAARSALQGGELAPLVFEVKEIGLAQTIIGPISLAGGSLEIGQVGLDYSLSSLRQARLKAITIDDLELNGEWTEQGITFGQLTQLFEQPSAQPGEDLSPERQPAEVRSLPFDSFSLTAARITLERADAPVVSIFDVSAAIIGGQITANLAAELQGPGLSGAVTWDGAINTSDFLSTEGKGSIELNAAQFVIPGDNQTVDMTIDIEMAAQGGAFLVSLNKDLSIGVPLPAFFSSLGLQALSGDRIFAGLTAADGDNPLLSIKRGPDDVRISSNLDLRWTGAIGNGGFGLLGWISLGQDSLPQDFLFERLGVIFDTPQTSLGSLAVKFSADGLKGPIAVAEGPITFEIHAEGGLVNELRYTDLVATGAATFRLDGLSLAFDLSDFTSTIEGLSFRDELRFVESARIDLSQAMPNSQSLTTVFGADGSATVTFDVGLDLDSGSVTYLSDDSETRASLRFPALGIEGFWVADDNALDLGVIGNGGELLSDFGSVLDLTIDAFGSTTALDGTFSANVALDTGLGTGGGGLPTSGEFRRDGSAVSLDGIMRLASGDEILGFDFSYDLENEGGRVNAVVGPITVGGNGISPATLSPLGLPFTLVSGDVFADLSIPLGNSPSDQHGEVLVRDLEIDTGSFRLEQINAATTLRQVWPPIAEGAQQLAIGLLQAGVPLTNFLASYTLAADEQVKIDTLTMEFGGGRITVEPVTIGLSSQEHQVTFNVENVQLTEVAMLSGLDGLAADGILSGTIPVRIGNGDAVVEGGLLTTDQPGWIRYRSDQTTSAVAQNDGGFNLALQALEDFQYESLSLALNGSLSQELEAALSLKGRNPNLYDGYPIEFNLNLSGELANVIQGSLAGYRVPETIKQQLMAFPPSQPR